MLAHKAVSLALGLYILFTIALTASIPTQLSPSSSTIGLLEQLNLTRPANISLVRSSHSKYVCLFVLPSQRKKERRINPTSLIQSINHAALSPPTPSSSESPTQTSSSSSTTTAAPLTPKRLTPPSDPQSRMSTSTSSLIPTGVTYRCRGASRDICTVPRV